MWPPKVTRAQPTWEGAGHLLQQVQTFYEDLRSPGVKSPGYVCKVP